MRYYELLCTVFLQKDIYYNEQNEAIGRFINKSMTLDEELKSLHESKGYKFYVYDTFFPREEDKVYKKGRIYIFKIRSIDRNLLIRVMKTLLGFADDCIKIISTELREYKKSFITELYTVTPTVLTVDNRFWVKGDSLELLERRIQDNLIKKYQVFFKEDLDIKESFIQGIELKNQKTIAINYKNIKLMGNKFRIFVKEDELSQKLATMALATGLLEKNSSNGMGFCIAK